MYKKIPRKCNPSAFISTVLGAVMIGWSVVLLFALFGPFRRGQLEGWRMVTVSLAAWFNPDTAFSLLSGFWQNAVLNCVMALLFTVPHFTCMPCFACRTFLYQ